MDLTDEQWALLQPLLPAHPYRTGRPWQDDRAVLNGITWVMRSAGAWRSLPAHYPSYKTCHRRYREWCRTGVMKQVLKSLYQDLCQRGGLDLTRCSQDGRFVFPRPGAPGWGCLDGVDPAQSWQLSTALVFIAPLAAALRRRGLPAGDWGGSKNPLSQDG